MLGNSSGLRFIRAIAYLNTISVGPPRWSSVKMAPANSNHQFHVERNVYTSVWYHKKWIDGRRRPRFHLYGHIYIHFHFLVECSLDSTRRLTRQFSLITFNIDTSKCLKISRQPLALYIRSLNAVTAPKRGTKSRRVFKSCKLRSVTDCESLFPLKQPRAYNKEDGSRKKHTRGNRVSCGEYNWISC